MMMNYMYIIKIYIYINYIYILVIYIFFYLSTYRCFKGLFSNIFN